jgi:hypothetical protein
MRQKAIRNINNWGLENLFVGLRRERSPLFVIRNIVVRMAAKDKYQAKYGW